MDERLIAETQNNHTFFSSKAVNYIHHKLQLSFFRFTDLLHVGTGVAKQLLGFVQQVFFTGWMRLCQPTKR